MMPMPEKDGSLIGVITQVDLPNMVSIVWHFLPV